ncbi:inosine 5'-monophosphate dehydrogenase [Novipirellula galeiformis]|uniref:Inosine 5'-monophosphate dehydrogenase n=1 Tax=Novipirellula galeiformis TaxID=2528004 RepID=A0A5C6CI78_9BACT|nr:CBS domain-containing protein [Novipirellula galeiformis]TWU23387.1 inosine 5'-monophosphate dehydrogenase [Novipirellula galeiformis]
MNIEPAPNAAEIMTSHIQTIGPAMKLDEIVTFLLKHQLSSVPVVDSQGEHQRLLGFLSESDCLEFMSNELFYGSPSPPQRAETIMKKHPVCVGSETDLFALTSIFTSHHYRHLPVVQDQNLLGIVSRRDILQSLDRYYRDWIRRKDVERFPVDVHQIINHRFIMG